MPCGGLSENFPSKLRCLNTWSSLGMSRIRRQHLAKRSIHLGIGCSKSNHTPDLISLLLACSSRSEPSACVLPPWNHKHINTSSFFSRLHWPWCLITATESLSPPRMHLSHLSLLRWLIEQILIFLFGNSPMGFFFLRA